MTHREVWGQFRFVRGGSNVLDLGVPVNGLSARAAVIRDVLLDADEEATATIISVPQAFNEDELYVDLGSIFGQLALPEV